MENLVEVAKTWVLKVALKKMMTRAIPWATAIVVAFVAKVNIVGQGYGVSLSVKDTAIAAGIASALTVLQNWLKVKFNLKFL